MKISVMQEKRMTNSGKHRILHIDDDKNFLIMFGLTFNKFFDIVSADVPVQAFEIMKTIRFDAVITDFEMPQMDGLMVLKSVQERYPDMPVIFYTAQGNEQIAREAFLSGVADYLVKEVRGFAHRDKLVHTINQAIDKAKINEALREKQRLLEEQFRFSSALNEISEIIINEDNVQLILEKTAEILGRTLKLDRSLIYSIDFKKHIADALSEWLNPDVPGITPTKATYNLDIFINSGEYCFKERKQIESHIDDKNQLLVDDGSAEILHNRMNIKSLLWHPFLFLENGFYALIFNQITHRRVWSEAEHKFIESASNQVSIALQKLEFLKNLKQAEARLEHINKVVVAVRSITQLISREDQEKGLLKKICETIVSFDIYEQAIVATFESDRRPISFYQAGFGDKGNKASDMLLSPPRSSCLNNALTNCDKTAIHESGIDCSNCPFSMFFKENSYVISRGFRYGDGRMGYLGIQTKQGVQVEDEEISMFNEICDDIAYALDKFEIKQKHQETERQNKEKEELYRIIIENSNDSIAILIGEQYVFANEAMQALLGYTLEEIRKMPMDKPMADTPEGKDKISGYYKSRLNGEKVPSRYKGQLASKDGRVIEVYISANSVTLDGKKGSIIIVQPVTEEN
ncbi:MAG: response regulator [Firmicutes bacterium]|nr:response regulator [Bacillota bacterium]